MFPDMDSFPTEDSVSHKTYCPQLSCVGEGNLSVSTKSVDIKEENRLSLLCKAWYLVSSINIPMCFQTDKQLTHSTSEQSS